MRASLAALALVLPAALLAQPVRKIEGELSGNAYFGNTQQVLASVRAERERSDSAFSLRVQLRFNYGEATSIVAGGEDTQVSKRSWTALTSYDFRPFGRYSPFLKATVESSLENRVLRRYALGTGARLNLARRPGTELVASLGAAGERTEPRPEGDTIGVVTRARGLTSLRWKRDLSERVGFSGEATYEPALDAPEDYTAGAAVTTKVRLARFASLTFSVRDRYDSRAIARGARTNNDGEVLFGVLTTF